ncbi:DEAD/DEAH box helicase [Woodsholea maritima]|uniref:DEAD/DEAH box helicase n=1 Tax=Woodsholea maritima TaxID=240237 RepID=UPI0003A49318|nr:DEAD/DEAH box helicase [Woodsholea maritima]
MSLTQFIDLGLADPILSALAEEGYQTPTPIQAAVIPAMMKGRDILGIAQTGTGKTAAFVLPALNKIAEGVERPAPKSCRTLILTPTRELALQIAHNVRAYGQNIRFSSTTVVGGASAYPQIKAMARGVDILIATPGRLLDHVRSKAITLHATETVILDEADQMMDLGFMPAVRQILASSAANRQCVMLTATMPKQIRALADEFLKNPECVEVAPQSKPIERIDQSVWFMERAEKQEKLHELLSARDMERGIVFTRTKRGADKVCEKLESQGFDVAAIHGDKSQPQRSRALRAFREGKLKVLVATDIAARGIDIDGVSHVFNFELPNVPEAYVHRIGRTARAGASGIAVSFCDASERSYLYEIERLTKTRLRFAAQDEAGEELTDPRDLPHFGREGSPSSRRGTAHRPRNKRPPVQRGLHKPHPRDGGQGEERGERKFNDRPRRDNDAGGERRFNRDDKPRGDRPYGDRPRRDNDAGGERRFNRDDKPRGDRPYGDRPRRDNEAGGERRFNRDDKPRGDRPYGDRPRRDNDAGGERRFNRDDKPRGDRPYGDRPRRDNDAGGERRFNRDDKPRGDRPYGDRPRRDNEAGGERRFNRDDKPRGGDRPFGDRPRRDNEAGGERRFNRDDKPRGDRPYGDRPRRDNEAGGERRFNRDDKPRGGDRPFGDRPRRDNDAGGERRFNRDDKPRGDRPNGDRPRRDNEAGGERRFNRDDKPRTGAKRPSFQGRKDGQLERRPRRTGEGGNR